ncbi:hypothetical protein F4678DRAFT_484705 [Xylaria arbuscula]|nr:hypothetical protein F4678DRAFT_484705 [Xylaria arbuscula]
MDRQVPSEPPSKPKAPGGRIRLKDDPDSNNYTPVRETYLQQDKREAMTKRPPKTDRDMYEREDYLRNKWGCNDAIPDPFDPDKLDASFRAKFSMRNRQKEQSETRKKTQELIIQPETNIPATAAPESQKISLDDATPLSSSGIRSFRCNASSESIFTTSANQSLDNNEQILAYESEASASDYETTTENMTQERGRSMANVSRRGRATSDAKEGPSTPRIRAGSKPPLSRSAYVDGGVPCEDERCRGDCKQGRGHGKPPVYFPFKSRVRKSSRSRGRQA